MPLPKVLVACPQSDVKLYCWDQWVDNVQQFTYPAFAVFLADNSLTNNFSRKIRQAGMDCQWIKPFGKSLMQRIAESHEACRQTAIRGDFDYMLHLESDVLPPHDIIEALLSRRKSVVGAVYHIGIGKSRELMLQVVEETDDEHFVVTRPAGADAIHLMNLGVNKVFSVGLGCVLIHKSVFPHFRFRYEKGINQHPDSFFANDLYRKGIDIYADTSIVCEHLNQPHSIQEFLA